MFKPVNRYILVEEEQKDVQESLIVLPDDYKPAEERYTTVKVREVADDEYEVKTKTKTFNVY